MRPDIQRLSGHRERSAAALLLPVFFLLLLCVYSTVSAQSGERYWELLTLFGGDGDETYVRTMVHDAKRDHIIIIGRTMERDLPVTPDALKRDFTDMMDGYIAVFNSDCSELLYCSYLGGSDNDAAVDAVILDDDRMMVVVSTYSRDLPTTGTAWDREARDEHHVWLAVFSLETFGILHAGYFGGNGDDGIARIMKMMNGSIMATGHTSSPDLPVTPDAFQSRKIGWLSRTDAWIAIFDSSFALDFCSYHGGVAGWETARSGLAETDHYLVFTGETDAPDLPVTENAYQSTFADGDRGWSDAYMAVVSKDDKRLVYSTYLGGVARDFIGDIIVAHDERIVLVGWTDSPDFPVTPNAWQSGLKDTSGYTYADIMVAVFSLREMRFEHITYIGGHGVDVAGSAIYDADRDVVRILATSGSDEFPFLAPKASNNSFRGVLLDFDVRQGVPISAIPVVDFRSTYPGTLLSTTTGRLLVTGRLAYDIKTDVLPIRPSGFKTTLSGLRDVFIGELHDTPVHVERIAEPVNSDGALRVLTNPARSEIRFVVEGVSPETATVLLYDLLGRRVAGAPLLHNGRNAHGRMQVQGLAPGMYILAAPGPDGVRTAKVVVTQ
jgi:hypothetical protein